MDTLVKKYLPLSHSDQNVKKLFPTSAFSTIYRPNKNLKVLKAIGSLVVKVLTSETILWFLKSCLLVRLLVRNISLKMSYNVTPVMLYIW